MNLLQSFEMPPLIGNKFKENLRFSPDKFLLSSCKTLIISVLVVYAFFIYYSSNPNCQPSECLLPSQHLSKPQAPTVSHSPPTTNLSHLVFGISASVKAWRNRKSYIESWWKPNVTQGFVYFDRPPTKDLLPWPSSAPPFRVSENATKFEVYKKHVKPFVIRIVRTILETFNEQKDHKGVRWYVMGDDDTIFFSDNLLEVLGKYDHTKYFYIGGTSECTKSNFDFSFEMAYGGGGFALSYPLAAALVKNLDKCINRYPYLHVSDQILQYCISDLGVSVTLEKGFHQLDLVHDISGFLSAHPQSPLVTLHHLDIVLPIFPSLSRHEALDHFMKAASFDQSRLLQQTICYQKQKRWSFSIAWGYSAYIYELILPRSILKRPLETFIPWSLKPKPPDYMFNTRPFLPKHPCDAPHIFFFESIEKNTTTNTIISSYVRSAPRGVQTCPLSNNSADYISKIQVFSSPSKLSKTENRGECCDIIEGDDMEITKVNFRTCLEDEIVA